MLRATAQGVCSTPGLERTAGADGGGGPLAAERALAFGEELVVVLLASALPLVGDELGREALGAARCEDAGVGSGDAAGPALPPALARGAAALHLAHEVVLLELAEVVAGGAARLAQ